MKYTIENKSVRVYCIGEKDIIPGGDPVEVTAEEAKHPTILAHAKAGHLVITEIDDAPSKLTFDKKAKVDVLKAFAAQEEIDLSGATSKDEIVAVIEKALADRAGD